MLCGKPSLSGFPAGFAFCGTAPLAVAAIKGSDKRSLPQRGADIDIFGLIADRAVHPVGRLFRVHENHPFSSVSQPSYHSQNKNQQILKNL